MDLYLIGILGAILLLVLIVGKKILGIKWSIFFIVTLFIAITGIYFKPYINKAFKPKLSLEKISQLITILENSQNNEEIKNAVIMLGDYEVQDEKVVSLLKKLIETSEDNNIVKESIFSLAFIENEKILPYYKELLRKSNNSLLRRYIVLGFKNIITKEARFFLFSIIEEDKDFEARRTAAYVLGQSKNKAYEQKFIKFLDLTLSQNLVVKATELYIRVNILNEFLNKLTEDDKYKKYIADKSSAENDIKMIEEFIINLKDKKYIKLKDRAFIALERTKLFDSMVTDVLEGEKKSELKERAEKALSVIGDIEDLINEYIKENEKQEEMMLLSSIVLGGIKSKKAVQELIRIFENTENNWLKKEIVIALGNIGDEKAENTLINNFGKSVDREVDEEIVVSLGRIKGRKSIKVLLKSVKTYPDKWVRIKAVESLNGIKVDSVIDELWADFEKESDVDVKNAIINYMKNSGSNKTPDRLKSVILDTREENEARLNAARSFLASKYVNRKEKNLLKGEMISTLTGASSDNEKIFVLDTVRELVIIEALEAVCQLKKSKNPQIRERAVKTAVVLTATYKQ